MKKTFFLLLFILSGTLLFAANGDSFGRSIFAGGYSLLDAQSLTTDGVWVNTTMFRQATYCFSGLEAGGSVTIQGSNTNVKPTNPTDGHTLATLAPGAGTACAAFTVLPVRWIKAEKVQGGVPTATTVIIWGHNTR